jgi:hypothetical protein
MNSWAWNSQYGDEWEWLLDSPLATVVSLCLCYLCHPVNLTQVIPLATLLAEAGLD